MVSGPLLAMPPKTGLRCRPRPIGCDGLGWIFHSTLARFVIQLAAGESPLTDSASGMGLMDLPVQNTEGAYRQ